MIENYNNVGAVIKAGELIGEGGCSEEELFNALSDYVEGIGYKGRLGEQNGFSQSDAWKIEIVFIKDVLEEAELKADTYILFEYMLPNENTIRPDIIILHEERVSIFEFKTIGGIVNRDYVAQFIDYGKIISDYHLESRNMEVESYLVMCECNTDEIVIPDDVDGSMDDEDRHRIIGRDGFVEHLRSLNDLSPMEHDDVLRWINSRRRPGRSVATRSRKIRDALNNGPEGYYSRISGIPIKDIKSPIDAVFDLSRQAGKKIIFVSGVPGAGKTLVGMILLFGILGEGRSARYYTGNGALQDVLKTALRAPSEIKILNGFRFYHVFKANKCDEDLLIFDEAQRFWSAERVRQHVEEQMRRNTENEDNQNDYSNNLVAAAQRYIDAGNTYLSDAKSIIDANYTKENVTIVCLIGDGQKPMNGEAGIEAWIEALHDNNEWSVYIPKKREDEFEGINNVNTDFDLHLSVSQRAHFVDVSPWVEAVLRGDLEEARNELNRISDGNNRFDIKITRSLGSLYVPDINGETYLKRYKKEKEAENDMEYLYGILCSSHRYVPEGRYVVRDIYRLSENVLRDEYNNGNLFIKNNEAYAWYSGGCCETNIKNVKAATETFCQGLEVDLPIVFFRGDFLLKQANNTGYEWVVSIGDSQQERLGAQYAERVKDTYRILLTRATEEMIIVIPNESHFDDTYNFFRELGIPELGIPELVI